MIRFIVYKGDKEVSVYFDAYAKLAFMRERNGDPIPYFEIYPSPYSNDVQRYYVDETETMMGDIRKVLERTNEIKE